MTTQSADSGSSAISAIQSIVKVVERSVPSCLERSRRGRACLPKDLLLAAAAVLLAAFSVAAEAQSLAPTWSQQSPANNPGQRYIHSMAYDAGHGQVVLFGGYAGGGYANDTWLWNGANWTQASPLTVPPQRAAPAMVYDPVHGNVVMFGGFVNAGTRLNDTWLWDGTNWTNVTPATITATNSPSPRSNAGIAFDATLGEVVLFGGTNGSGLADTWLWNGSTWTQWNNPVPSSNPAPRAEPGMAYDAATSQVVLFGGSVNGVAMSDTWTWNGSAWSQQAVANAPAARDAQGMDYNAALGEVVMFGGESGSNYFSDTWAYNGTNWTQITTPSATPQARLVPNAMVYDSAHQQMVMFGGYTGSSQLSDTWELGVPGNFGNVNVCSSGQTAPSPCSSTISFTYTFANGATLAATPTVVTQGVAGLDFTVNAEETTCSGTVAPGTCTVTVNFAPSAPGLRSGAINLFNSGGNLLVSTALYGVGQGPAIAYNPGTQTTLNTGAYSFNQPKGLTTDAAGNLYVADTGVHGGNRYVLKITPDGAQTTLGSGLDYPQGIAVDGAGDLFVADNDLNQVVKIPAGCTSSACQQVVPTPTCVVGSSGLCAQQGVAVDGPGNVFVASFNGEVLEVPVNGGAQTVLYGPAGSHPVGIAVDAAGDLFIADVGLKTVVEVPAGCTTASCQSLVGSGWNQPNDVAVDAAGDVFVSDAGLQQIVEVPAGCGVANCQIALTNGIISAAVAVDAVGNVYADDLSTNSIVEVNRSQIPVFNFATTNVGTTSSDSPKSTVLQNIGNQTLQAENPTFLIVATNGFANVAGPGTFPDCFNVSSLAPSTGCDLSIDFRPQTTGTYGSIAVFHDNDLNDRSATQVIYLYGSGMNASYTVGGTVSGLTNGSGLVLQNNGGDNQSIGGNGLFTFPTALATGGPYNVTVLTQPEGQVCTVTNGSGTVGAANISNVQVNCANPVNYALAVTVSGTGTGTVMDDQEEIACSNANEATLGFCSGSYAGGTQVALTAAVSGTSIFAGWGGACSSFGTSATCVLTMNSALNASATFVAPPPAQSGALKPITAGVVYGQSGSFASGGPNNGGVTPNSLGNAQGMVIDAGGNLYISDGANNRVLYYPAGGTTPTRVYGQNGSFTSSASNNGGISASSLRSPQGIALDSSGNVYISDEYNSRVLFYPSGSTTATRVYGQPDFTTGGVNTGGISANSLNLPMGIALDSGGNLYVADYGNSRVLFYPAGSTTATQVYGQGGSFTSNAVNNGGITANSLNQAQAVALDSSGDLYVADLFNNRVLFYPANSTTATQVYGQAGSFTTGDANAGGVSANSLNSPSALTIDGNGGLYVADRSNNRVLYYPFGSNTASRVYGQSGSFTGTAQNSGGVSANSLSQPWGVALDNSRDVYVADYGNSRVLEYGSFGNVNACPAGQGNPAPCNNTVTFSYAPASTTAIGATQVVTEGATGLDFTPAAGGTCNGSIAVGSTCTVNVNFAPRAPGLRKGAVELFDSNGNIIASSLTYGVGQEPELVFGSGTQSIVGTGEFTLSQPKGLLTDAAGNLFISDAARQQVIKIAANGTISTVGAGLQFPQGIAEDGAGDLFIADNNLNEVVEVPAGCTDSSCQVYLGANYRSQLGVAVDGAGDVFFGDFLDGEVIESPAGCTTTGCQTIVYKPAAGSTPVGLAVDATGNLYVADLGLKQVIKTPAGCLSSACQISIGSGFWNQPDGVAVDAAGDIFVADAGLDEVVEAPAGCTATACLNVVLSGINTVAIAVDAAGDLFVDDLVNSRVIELSRVQLPSLSFAQTNVGVPSSDSPKSISLQNIGNQPLTGTAAFNLGGSFTQTANIDCSTAFPLSPGASCIDTFSFVPTSATFFPGSVVFTDNNLNGSAATQSIALSGIGATGGVAGSVAVPNVVGQAQTAVSAPIAAAGLAMGTVTKTSSSTVPSGSVISQSPVAGTQVAVGSTVNLLVSSGQPEPAAANPLSLNNNYFLTGDYVSAGVTLRGTGVGGMATGNITVPSYASSPTQGVPDGADIVDAFLYWQTLENTATPSSTNGIFNKYPVVGQQIGVDIPNYVDGAFTGTIRSYRANVNIYLPVGANGIRLATGTYTVSLPDGGKSALPLTEGASLVFVYRVLSPNFPLKSVVIYDGSAAPKVAGTQVMQGFYDAVGGANGTAKSASLFSSGGTWKNTVSSVTLGQSNQYSAPLNAASAYAAVILSTLVNNSDNDGILDAWKAGPVAGDFHAGQPGYYDAKTGAWVGLPGAKHGQKDLFVQLDYMCGAVLSNGSCDPTKENLFPSPDADGNDPLAMVQQAFVNSGVQLHLQVGNAVSEDTCIDTPATASAAAVLCQFPGQSGVVGWKNSLEFSKLYPRNIASCFSGGDCTTRFPYGQKDSYHYVLMGHSLAIPAWNTRYGTLTSIVVANGTTTITTVDRGTGINKCPGRITLSGVLGDPALNGVYNTTGCADTKTITIATPGVANYTYPNNTLPEPVIGLTSGTISSISGYSDLGGADSAVTLGLWLTYPNQDMSKRANVLAGTLFHEIGHTLGLSHGGLYYDTPGSYIPTFDGNCKPNYQSVMNYLFQLDLLGPNQTVAFSNQTLATLNENSAGSVTQLTDSSGNAATFPTSAWYVPYTSGSTASAATLHCDGTPLNGESGYRVDAPIAPITPPWTNGEDLSFTGVLQSAERGYNDLSSMDLRQVGATGGEFAALASAYSFGLSESPLNISAGGTVALGSGGTVALGSGGTVALGSGGNVTLSSGGTVTLTSGGTVALGSGGSLTIGASGGTVAPGVGGTVALGSGGTVTLSSGGTIALGSGGTVALGSGGTVALGSGGTIALGSGGTVTIPSTGGSYTIDSNGGTIALGSGGTVALGSGGTVTLSGAGTIALGSGGTVALGSGGTVALGSGGTVALGSGGTIALGSGGNVTLSSGGTIALGSGGTVALGSGGTVALGSGGTVTLGGGGNLALSSGGTVALGSGGTATLGAGGTVTLAAGGTVALGSGGTVALGSGGTIALGSGGTVALGSGGTVTLAFGGTVALGSGGAPIPIAPGGSFTFGSSGGTVALGSGGTVALGSGGSVTLSAGGTIALGSGGTIALGSGGTVALGSGGVVTLGNGGSVTMGGGTGIALGSVSNITPASGGPLSSNELTYETANSIVRPPSSPTETATPAGVRINWKAPAFGVVETYTIYRSSNGATPIVIGSVSGVNGNPPATEFTDTNPDLISKTVIYTVTTTLVPDAVGPSRSSAPSAPAVLKNDQSIVLGPLPSSVTIANPPVITATAMSGGVPNGLQVVFTAAGSCAISSQSIVSNVSSAIVALTSTGSCTISASQPGTTAFNPANTVSGTFIVLPLGSATKSQIITFAPLPSVKYGATFSLSASSSSGLPVSFTASGPCTTNGVINGVGLCTITASVQGNNVYSAASLTQAFNIYPAVLKVMANSFAIGYGQPIPPLTYGYSGFVNNDSASVISGAAALSTTATPTSNAGTYPVTVATGTLAATNYSFLYVSGSLTVQQANQMPLTLMTSGPLAYGQSETMSVSGGSTGGAVTYNLIGGSCSIAGARLTATSGTGSCQVTATMAGSTNYNSVTSAPANLVPLSLAPQTITFTTSPPASAVYNSTFTVSATGGSSANAITFASAGACSNSGATYRMTSGTGVCSVIANQAGNGNYAPAGQATKAVTAGLATPSTTFAGAPASAAYQAKFTVVAATNASTAAVITSAGACSNVGTGIVMTSGTGTCSLTATWAADSNFNAAKASQSTTATPLAQIITFTTNPPTSAAYGSRFTVAAIGGGSTDAVTFTSSGSCSNAGAIYTMNNSTGTCLVIANQAGNSNYAAAAQVTKTVAATGPVVTVSPSSIDFGTVYQGSITMRSVTVSNVGTAPVTITDPILSIAKGGDSNEFVAVNLCPKPLAAGKSCTVTIAFVAGPFYNPQTATLQIMSNAPGSPQPVALSALVINPKATTNPTSLSFGTIKHATSSTLNVNLSNPGSTPLSLIAVSITGTNAANFVQSNNCGTSLAAGASCAVMIRFTPPATGTFTANLTIRDNAQSGSGTQTVPLSGKGS